MAECVGVRGRGGLEDWGEGSLAEGEEGEGGSRQTTCWMLNQVCRRVKESVWTAPDTYGSSGVTAGSVFEWVGV